MQAEIIVWHAALDVEETSLQLLRTFLSEDEHIRAARFHFERDRRRWIAARGLLRAALGRLLTVPPESLHFELGPWGKPSLRGHSLHFNLSHTHNQMLMAFAWDQEVGVDVELWRDDFSPLELASQVFSVSEQRFLRTFPPAGQHQAFLTLWTAKEAYIKAIGKGLSFPLSQLTLLPTVPGSAWSVLDVTNTSERPSLCVYSLTASQTYAAALAIEHNSIKQNSQKETIFQETVFSL